MGINTKNGTFVHFISDFGLESFWLIKKY